VPFNFSPRHRAAQIPVSLFLQGGWISKKGGVNLRWLATREG